MSSVYCDDDFPHAQFNLNKRAKKIVKAFQALKADCFCVGDIQAFYRFAQDLRNVLDTAEEENKAWYFWNN